MILVITSAEDVHADFVIPKLHNLGVEVCRFHPNNFLSENKLSFSFQDEIAWNLTTLNNEFIDFSEISAIYYRKPFPPKSLDSTVSEMQEFCEAESGYFIKSFLDYLSSLTNAKWINNYQKIRLAENKPLQFRIAKSLGLTLPKTIITNNPSLAYDFYLGQSKDIVLKALVGKGLPNKKLFYTTRLGENLKKNDFDSVKTTATYFQEFIEKAYDIRIVIVESSIFSVKIESQEFTESSTDFRATDNKKLKHSIIELPSPLKERLLKLVESFGLVHAEIDMCVTKDGQYIFFEINPNGQWLWLELQTDIKISDAFVNALVP